MLLNLYLKHASFAISSDQFDLFQTCTTNAVLLKGNEAEYQYILYN